MEIGAIFNPWPNDLAQVTIILEIESKITPGNKITITKKASLNSPPKNKSIKNDPVINKKNTSRETITNEYLIERITLSKLRSCADPLKYGNSIVLMELET